MPMFRKKPVVIEAWRFDSFDFPAWLGNPIAPEEADGPYVMPNGEELCIPTLEGTMTASVGDWIIKGVNGELYPCKPDIFEKTYEPEPTTEENATPEKETKTCPDCGEEVDENGDTKSSAADCAYCPVDCHVCGYGTCDSSC